jgi:hypothetical protein
LLAKTEGSFCEAEPQVGQPAGSPAWLMGRICSNSFEHFSHQYS